MSSGLYPAPIVIERYAAGALSIGNLAQPFLVPFDMEVVGLVASVSTAPGGTANVMVNISVDPLSQGIAAYNLWTNANAPQIVGTSTRSFTTSNATTLIENRPYALNYPLPGGAGTSGYATAQATSQVTETPVTAPPTMEVPSENALTAPDNTYTDLNGFTDTPANIVHAGDILTFAVGSNLATPSVGAAAGLAVALYLLKR